MKDLIEIFRMEELKPETRINIIIKLGDAINEEYAMNITEPIVYELVKVLNPSHEILNKERYTKHLPTNQ